MSNSILCRPHAVTRLITDATVEPVTLDEAQQHLRVTDASDDEYISNLIKTARLHCERETNRSFITTTWRLSLDYFPGVIYPRKPPLISVSSITYYDTTGASQTLSSTYYTVDANSEPGRITEAYGYQWPSTYSRVGAVTVNYTAGYGAAASSVPLPIKQAMLLLIGHWFEMRSAVLIGSLSKSLEFAVESLLAPYVIPEYA